MEEILPEPILYSTGVFPIRIFAMLQTLKNANEVFVSYLRDHPGAETKYDLVIRTRPDLYFYSDIDLMQTLDPAKDYRIRGFFTPFLHVQRSHAHFFKKFVHDASAREGGLENDEIALSREVSHSHPEREPAYIEDHTHPEREVGQIMEED